MWFFSITIKCSPLQVIRGETSVNDLWLISIRRPRRIILILRSLTADRRHHQKMWKKSVVGLHHSSQTQSTSYFLNGILSAPTAQISSEERIKSLKIFHHIQLAEKLCICRSSRFHWQKFYSIKLCGVLRCASHFEQLPQIESTIYSAATRRLTLSSTSFTFNKSSERSPRNSIS